MKVIHVMNVPDFRREDGSWGKFYSEKTAEARLQMHSRAAVLWNNLKARCREGSAIQKNNICYTICENHFKGYEEFTDWCQDQYGYMNKNSYGTFWSLDKDVLFHGNKIYSPDTCMFIPQSVNNVLVGSDKSRGEYPIGVHQQIQYKAIRYAAACRQRDGSSYLGVYRTPIEAHRAWQLAKIQRILEEADLYRDHTKLFEALHLHADRIQNDYDNHTETKVESGVVYPK